MQTTQILELIGSRLPDPIRTGALIWSSGEPKDLKDGFDQTDCQAIDAPSAVASGSVRIFELNPKDSVALYGFTVQTSLRGVAA